ncbi:hypothetical protein N0B51_04555 [Tsuneonella sp. YG55]|uniref:OmpR/PhoB-type domain-containing protein n=1 Tax=Tsuneonella litorea TaxID=2976475 RepID=A0A9X3AKE1_9SPHN|nr:hypothetical protein [Tsuneonella litorea]MCT2558244.1 hypothetical protein [Tsuneonella litorea]
MLPEPDDGFVRLDATDSFRLGSIRVDPPSLRLIRDKQEIILEPRVMRVLIALAQASGQVVGHDALIERC